MPNIEFAIIKDSRIVFEENKWSKETKFEREGKALEDEM